jgi:hypothetical protein
LNKLQGLQERKWMDVRSESGFEGDSPAVFEENEEVGEGGGLMPPLHRAHHLPVSPSLPDQIQTPRCKTLNAKHSMQNTY